MILLVSLFSYFNGFEYGLSAYMKPYKTTDISRSHQRFLREMTCEERAKKFYPDDVSLPSGWNFCARPSVLNLQGNRRWRRKMTAFFSG